MLRDFGRDSRLKTANMKMIAPAAAPNGTHMRVLPNCKLHARLVPAT
jgi:hypothetical protein